jgi:hypothetical protein
MARRRHLIAALAVGTLAVTTTQASAAPDPLALVKQVARQANEVANGALRDVNDVIGDEYQFPPAGFVTTSISWSMAPGDLTPTFTPPNPATSHPTAWSCTTSTTTTTAHASCTPTSAYDPGTDGWACYDPFVVVDVNSGATPSDSVTGSAHCGETIATCTATTGTVVVEPGGGIGGVGTQVGHCQEAAFPHQPVPLECDADFGGAKPTATWTVRCAPVDP